ncbi:hypothetical protein, partial [Sphingomonas sp. PP-CC-3G-468]|uniref:hypothetical protein n=1 Tax=Sphingomonas sp. PP-CC-3G-468 TaxID=2135656 RepID=UPI001A9D3A32
VEKQYLYFRRLPIPQTGALAAAESGLRLLTQAAIEKRPLIQLVADCLRSAPAQVGNEHNRPGVDSVYRATV